MSAPAAPFDGPWVVEHSWTGSSFHVRPIRGMLAACFWYTDPILKRHWWSHLPGLEYVKPALLERALAECQRWCDLTNEAERRYA